MSNNLEKIKINLMIHDDNHAFDYSFSLISKKKFNLKFCSIVNKY